MLFAKVALALAVLTTPIYAGHVCEVEFILYNADTDQPVGPLLAHEPIMPNEFNIQARPSPSCTTTVKSAKLNLKGPIVVTNKSERSAPYMVFGDGNGNIYGRDYKSGYYTISATLYSNSNLQGVVVSGEFKFQILPAARRSQYDIDITTSTDPGWTISNTIKSFFDAASAKWSTVITGGLDDQWMGALAGTSTPSLHLGGQFGTCLYPELIDDLWICASEGDLGGGDADGTITLAYARVLDIRFKDNRIGLPVTGLIAFNNQALGVIPDELWLDVTVHEIGHTLGIGSLWKLFGLATDDEPPCSYLELGEATKKYKEISGCSNTVPLEDSTGYPMSDCHHWDEYCFADEVMTPFISLGSISNPISPVTIGTLDDLGYTVSYAGADRYTTFNPACKCPPHRDLASTDETMTMMTTMTMTTHQVDETRHKRSLADPDHPHAHAIAKAKRVLAAMIDEAPGPEVLADDGSNSMTRAATLWLSFITYDMNTETAHSYIITPADLDDNHT